jgi:hypothetical protein
MFIGLLGVTFLVALAVALIVARGFTPSLDRILRRIISDEIRHVCAGPLNLIVR